MKRFRGEQLSPTARIALVTGDALGNYIVATPLLQMLREKYPRAILHYFGGPRTRELWAKESLIDYGSSFVGHRPREVAQAAIAGGPYDLVVNLEDSEWARSFASLLAGKNTFLVGPVLNDQARDHMHSQRDLRGALWRDPDWMADDLIHWYPFLDSGFIGEIFCRLCYLEGPIPGYRIPIELCSRNTPNVIVSLAASIHEKLWPVEKWLIVVRALQEKGHSVGVVGARPVEQKRIWKGGDSEEILIQNAAIQDLRGKLTLPQISGALQKAKLLVSIDNGILHMAAATETPAVGIFRHGIHRLWAPPVPTLTVISAGPYGSVASIPVSAVRHAAGL